MTISPRGREGDLARRDHWGYGSDQAPEAPEDVERLVLVVDAFRVGALAYAVVMLAIASGEYRRPMLAWLVLALLAVWTICLLALRARSRPQPGWVMPAVMTADLVVVVSAVIATRWLDDPQRILDGAQTLPSFYAAAPVLSWAVRWGWRGSLIASGSVAAADLIEVGEPSSQTVANIVLLVLGGLVVGYAAELVRQGRAHLAAAVAQRAATAERERLARDIHDSVLQVLGFVHRAGAGRPGQAGELAVLAGQQEARLRALIATGPATTAVEGQADLRGELIRFAGDRVTVSAPADPVLVTAVTVTAVAAATGEALSNVWKHAGAGAQAWILVEDEPGAVTVTVRDDGPGLAAGRLDEARETGRLGVAMSIVGRIEEVGGQVLISGPPGEGTEVEIRVPRAASGGH